MKNHVRDMGCVLAILVALWVTNRWMDFDQGTRWIQAFDSLKYLKLTRDFPNLPTEPLLVKSHLAQRLGVHYAAAAVSYGSGIELGKTYEIFVFASVIGIGILLILIFNTFEISLWNRVLLYALFILNPYTLRYYFLAPAMVADLVYVSGLLIMLLGMRGNQWIWVCAGALLGQLGRQNMLILAPAILFWWIFDFQEQRQTKRWLLATLCLASILGAHWGTLKITHIFSEPTQHTLSLFWSIFTWMASPEFHARELADHLFRVFLPLVFVGAAALASGIGLRSWFERKTWTYWLLIAATQAPNILVDPVQQQKSQTRYTGFAMVPVLIIFAEVYFKKYPSDRSQSTNLALLGLIWIGSFHHLCSVVSWGGSPAIFSVVHLVLAVVFGILIRLSQSSPKPVASLS